MFFDSWSDVLRTLLVGTAAYAALVLLLRVSGKRTLAKLNAFDLVVTVAFGSVLATILLSTDVSWVEGVTALVLLAALQALVAVLSARLPDGRSVVNARPTLLMRDGAPLPAALRRQRMTEQELRQGLRASGVGSTADVAAAVLESDGSISVVTRTSLGDGSTLVDVPGWDRDGGREG